MRHGFICTQVPRSRGPTDLVYYHGRCRHHPARPRGGSAMQPNVPGGRTLLIVEDNLIAREGLSLVLRREGYAVTAVEHCGVALSLMQSGAVPDLILLDMLIP